MAIDVQSKLAGVLIPTFALRNEQDLGIGDTACMRDAIDFCQSQHLSVLQILPVNETGGDNSPYNAVSSMALDPVLLSMTPETVPGLSSSDLLKHAPAELRTKLKTGSVDYPAVKKLKLQLLSLAFDTFRKQELVSPSTASTDLRSFQEQNQSWLPTYTLFATIMHLHQGNACWPQWESAFQTPESAEQQLAESPQAEHWKLYREFCAYVQWVAFTQWREVKLYAQQKNVRLMGDIPFGVSRYSADVWGQRELFDLDWSGGAPPESFFQTDLFLQKWGQNWGIPLYRWDVHEEQDFAWWRQRVKYQESFFHYFRIDHVLGFFRVYAFPWIPERNPEFVELTPEQASDITDQRLPQFLPHPDEPAESAQKNCAQGEKLLRVILEAAGSMGVVAEDLGMVPDYVRPLLARLGIPGFYIPLFERQKNDQSFKPLKSMPALSLGTYATHDHAPLVVFYEDLVERWHGHDGHEAWLEMQRLMRFLHLDEQHPPKHWSPKLQDTFTSALLNSPCWLAMFMITDILGSKQRFNQPGSSCQSNWSQRLDKSLSDYLSAPDYSAAIKNLSQLIVKSQRG